MSVLEKQDHLDVARDMNRHVGERMKLRRRLLGLKQREIADALNMSFQQVQKYESGANRISAGRLYALALFLDVPVSYFFESYDEPVSGYEEDFPSSDSVDVGVLDNDETIKLFSAYYAIKDQDLRKNLLALIKTMG